MTYATKKNIYSIFPVSVPGAVPLEARQWFFHVFAQRLAEAHHGHGTCVSGSGLQAARQAGG